MKTLTKITTTAALLALTGCASIVSDSQYPVHINGPSGAKYSITNKSGQVVATGILPNTVTLKAGAGFFQGERYSIRYSTACEVRVKGMDTTVDPWYLGNILFGGVIGLLLVDPATGAMFKLPESVGANLQQECAK